MQLINGNWIQTIAVEIEKIYDTIADISNNLPEHTGPVNNYITINNHHTHTHNHTVNQKNIQVNTSLVIPENRCYGGLVKEIECKRIEPVKTVQCVGSGDLKLVKRGTFVINEFGYLQNV